MLPFAQQLVYAEMVRDGGSQAATFLDHRGGEWILFLRIKVASHDDYVERISFEAPLLINTERSAATSAGHGAWGQSNDLSWENAELLMAQILMAGPPPHEWAKDALRRMDFIIKARGQLPADMERILPTRHL